MTDIDTDPIWTSTTRRCSVCHEHKLFSEFSKCATKKNGIGNRCKLCDTEYVVARQRHSETGLSIENMETWTGSARFSNKTAADGDCLVWTGATTNGGYPMATIANHQCRVNRVVLAVKLGRHIAPGMTASHLCHNSRCVNKNHLVEESLLENVRRSYDDDGGRREKVWTSTTRRCPVCLEFKPFDAFCKDASTTRGIGHRCKICDKAYAASRRSGRQGSERHDRTNAS